MELRQFTAILTVIILGTIPSSAEAARKMVGRQVVPAAVESPAHSARQSLEAGWQAYQRGDVTEALTLYREAAERSPQDASLWYDVGCLYALLHAFDKAQDALQHALILNPRLASAYDALGQLREQAGDTEGALAWYTSADAVGPANAKYLRHLIRIFLQRNESEAARRAISQYLMFEPDDMDARYQLGVLELRANAPDLAVNEFHKILERFPDHVMALNGLGLASARLGKFERASEVLEKARTLNPEDARTQTNLGVVAAHQQQWDAARSAWKRALDINPQFAPAVKNLEVIDQLTTSSSP